MPKFTVRAPLDHDNKRYEAGQPVELSAEQAAPLLALDVIEERDAPAPAANDAPTDAGDRLQAVKDAIGALDAGTAAHWTGQGRPDLGAISDLLGWRATAAERDQAWAELSAAK